MTNASHLFISLWRYDILLNNAAILSQTRTEKADTIIVRR